MYSIAGDRFLAHRRAPRLRRGHLDGDFFRPRKEDVVRRDGDIFEARDQETVASPLRQLAIASRARHVGSVGEELVCVADPVGRRRCQKATFDVRLRRRVRLREAERRVGGSLPGHGQQRGGRDCQRRTETHRDRHFFKPLRISLAAF